MIKLQRCFQNVFSTWFMFSCPSLILNKKFSAMKRLIHDSFWNIFFPSKTVYLGKLYNNRSLLMCWIRCYKIDSVTLQQKKFPEGCIATLIFVDLWALAAIVVSIVEILKHIIIVFISRIHTAVQDKHLLPNKNAANKKANTVIWLDND